MSQQSIGPERICILEAYVKCLKRAERRIILGGQIANDRTVDLQKYHVQKPMILHIAATIRQRGIEGHGTALLRLQIARSKYARELEGI
jgi:hypothetical protein